VIACSYTAADTDDIYTQFASTFQQRLITGTISAAPDRLEIDGEQYKTPFAQIKAVLEQEDLVYSAFALKWEPKHPPHLIR
jgi:hypothetical protein